MKINLKDILKRKGIKNIELADKIGVGKQQITNYCSSVQTPPPLYIRKNRTGIKLRNGRTLAVRGKVYAHL